MTLTSPALGGGIGGQDDFIADGLPQLPLAGHDFLVVDKQVDGHGFIFEAGRVQQSADGHLGLDRHRRRIDLDGWQAGPAHETDVALLVASRGPAHAEGVNGARQIAPATCLGQSGVLDAVVGTIA